MKRKEDMSFKELRAYEDAWIAKARLMVLGDPRFQDPDVDEYYIWAVTLNNMLIDGKISYRQASAKLRPDNPTHPYALSYD